MRALIILALFATSACNPNSETTENNESTAHSASDSLLLQPEEMKYLKNIRQITFGGNNAEAYWSFDDRMLVFQSDYANWGNECDQIFYTNWKTDDLKTNQPERLSTGLGRTTCSYFLPDNKTIVYASTHLGDENCPVVPERRTDGKYVWPIYDSFDIFTADLDGNILNQLTNEPGYDAEATVSPKGDKIVFTSLRTGDLELYTMNIDGTDLKQITSDLGYDGGAFFSPDGSKLIWRASRPTKEEDVKIYKDLLADGLVMPTSMELYIANADGSNAKKLTDLGKANWAPFFHPSGEKIIFASNHQTERGYPFNLFMINSDGTGLTKITNDGTFDAFPVFSNDGKHLAFSSNRNNGGTRDTNLFVAEWIGD
jgi:Tol biopolymer transport system component